jgi:quinol monooxygenase YgiN
MDQAIHHPVTETSAVVELRQYTLHPGQRDTLIGIFENQAMAAQEAAGMRLMGQFRDLRDPNRFVWLRSFRDMPSRADALQAFYGGPVWKSIREAANATMVDSDNVLLLRPIDGADLTLTKRMTSLMVATIYLLQAPVDDEFVRFFNARVKPVMVATGAAPVASFRTEYAENNFPRLPVRTENAFVWFASYASAGEYNRHLATLWESKEWSAAQAELSARLKSPALHLELEPTARSLQSHADPYHYTTERTGNLHDFDFVAGSWTILNRRLKSRGVGSTEWDEFPSTNKAQILMGGVVNVDETEFPTKGWSGVTVRHFDLEKRQWSIYWINSRLGQMLPPVVGGFEGDIGLFYGEDTDDGRPVKVVYRWTKMGPDAARWEQAFSFDGSAWETNWVMELARTGP